MLELMVSNEIKEFLCKINDNSCTLKSHVAKNDQFVQIECLLRKMVENAHKVYTFRVLFKNIILKKKKG